MKIICLHGPESTGKSTLAIRLATHFGCEIVPEYGRAYCDEHGTDIGMAALVEIAQTHDAMTQAARTRAVDMLILDTDPLMTAVWADMMFGARDPWFAGFTAVADLYLLLDIDIPWVDDGLRIYGGHEERAKFFALSRAELDRRRVAYEVISGTGDARYEQALAAIARISVSA